MEQLIGPDIGGHPVWNLRPKTPRSHAATVPWHQGKKQLWHPYDMLYISKPHLNIYLDTSTKLYNRHTCYLIETYAAKFIIHFSNLTI